jgi:nucleoside-diphosphate-sugar epimerase
VTDHRSDPLRPLPNRVLVTGANGFLGMHVSTALVARGVAVSALVRRRDAAVAPGTIPVVGDLEDMTSLRRAVVGIDAVVHLAAHVHGSSADPDAIARVNVDSTIALFDVAVAAGARDFVFASSVKAVGESNESPWTEDAVPHPADPYGQSKLEAERRVREAARRHGVPATILRLPLVYGPGMKANALRLFQLVDRGIPLPLGLIHNRRSLLYTGNLTAALIAAMECPAGGETFFVSDDEDLSTPELVRAIARALGRPARLVPIPVAVLRAAGRAGDLVSRVVAFPLTTAAIDRLTGSLTVDCSRLKRIAGYVPPYSVADAMSATALWYRRGESSAAL